MDPFSIFSLWLMLFSIGFTFMPLVLVFDWAKRGTADGFSSVGLVLPTLVMSCWLRYGLIAHDRVNLYINMANLCIYAFYISAFAYYQPKRRYLYVQLLAIIVALFIIFSYVDSFPQSQRSNKMAAVAAGAQIFGMLGGIYDCARAIKLGHTEYIPAVIQYGIFVLTLHWIYFAFLIVNYYMLLANFAGLALNLFTISLYFFIPPLTWRVPVIGTGPRKKKHIQVVNQLKKQDSTRNVVKHYGPPTEATIELLEKSVSSPSIWRCPNCGASTNTLRCQCVYECRKIVYTL